MTLRLGGFKRNSLGSGRLVLEDLFLQTKIDLVLKSSLKPAIRDMVLSEARDVAFLDTVVTLSRLKILTTWRLSLSANLKEQLRRPNSSVTPDFNIICKKSAAKELCDLHQTVRARVMTAKPSGRPNPAKVVYISPSLLHKIVSNPPREKPA